MLALAQNLPQIITILLDKLPTILAMVGQAIIDGWPQISDAIMKALDTTSGKILAAVLVVKTLIKNAGILKLVTGGLKLVGLAFNGLVALISNPVALTVAAIVAGIAAVILNWDKVKEAFFAVWDAIKTALGTMKEWFASVGQWIGDKFKAAFDVASKVWSSAGKFFGNVASTVKDAFKNIGSWIGDKFRNAKESAVKAWNNIGQKFATYRENIKTAFQNIGDWFGTKFSNAKTSVINAWSNIGERFSHIREVILSVFKNAPNSFMSIGRNLMVGLYNGIVEKAQMVIDKIKGVADQMIGWAKNILGIESPSKVFKQIGQFVDLGMAGGVEGNLDKVQKAMNEMSDVVMDNVPEPELDLAIQNQRNRISSGFGLGGQMISVPRQETPRNLTVILELDRMQLARAVYQLNNQETQRVGMRLAGGYA
jgi:phage-related protein